MKYIVIRTHARTKGVGLYLAGKVYDSSQMEDAKEKLHPKVSESKTGIETVVRPQLIKEFHGKIKTKEEKRTRRRRTKNK